MMGGSDEVQNVHDVNVTKCVSNIGCKHDSVYNVRCLRVI